ncbi:unnamed protein product [Polarella glacialis]|uniref:GH16 domain-containing protein n=1 Tax=Polarella glacialis TaxID=89957 RepID=A0A813E8Q2_POLGL|nr:unnamed protein product [Polarella glacialis]CAE8652531.1 unnamed protein product [Polarella glacialis]|mmetsp:Transcript_76179/g.137484  ORF Transcript_76179/g.137484 Transcript_76179/m.137484 type:complete len:835 (-) Transcript_76179:180-2684(-)
MAGWLLLFAVLSECLVGASAVCPQSQWIDGQTPVAACEAQTNSEGSELELVFSDEFEVDGRTFADGHDPVWTAITGFPATNNQENAYDDSVEHATTQDGKLLLRVSKMKSQLELVNETNGSWYALHRTYTSAMLQTWNKFCFTGGVLEFSAELPGDADSPGLWPAFWLMGNLGRATIQESTDNVWPYSYSQCPGEAEAEVNQNPRKQQRINQCLGANWTDRYGFNKEQGRGAIEIDILEVMPGKRKTDYQKEKVDTKKCPFQPSSVTDKLNVQRPLLFNTIMVAPGIPFKADQRPKEAGPLADTTCYPHFPTQWYPELRTDNSLVYGNYLQTTINAENYGHYIKNVQGLEKDVEMQYDAIGAVSNLPDSAFKQQHRYRFEWNLKGSGGFKFFMDDNMLYSLDGALIEREMPITSKGEKLGMLLARQMLSEPAYMVLNIDISPDWGIEAGGCCLDCKDPECIYCAYSKLKDKSDLWLYHLCNMLPATYALDYVRIYQSKADQAVGEVHGDCSPKEAPTQGWIESHKSLYLAPNYDAPLQPVYAGGARCETDAHCGSAMRGTCLKGLCQCKQDWTGPACLARPAGAALTCRPLEENLVGGSPCNPKSKEPQCGSGSCVRINRQWDAPKQTWQTKNREKGEGEGRCICGNDGQGGPRCNRELTGSRATKWAFFSNLDGVCNPAPEMASWELEELIQALCKKKELHFTPLLAQACSEILWTPHWEAGTQGGNYSRCGAWPRASWALQHLLRDSGLCCADMDAMGHKRCHENVTQFPALLVIAGLTLLLTAAGGCAVGAHLRGGFCTRQQARADKAKADMEMRGYDSEATTEDEEEALM